MKLRFGLLVFSAASVLGAASAGATTYTADYSENGATAVVSITTDGALGILAQSDISNFNIDVTDANGSADINPTNASVGFFGPNNSPGGDNGDLTATPTSLLYNFREDGANIDFQGGSGYLTVFCFQSNGCGNFNGPEVDFATNFEGQQTEIAESGETIVATAGVSAAPEPSTWLLMFAGIGGIGLMLRRAKKTMGFRFKDALSA